MQKTLFLLYVLYEFAQIAAITLGLEQYFKLEMLIAMPAGILIALVPLVGTAVAIVAAMYVWQLHWMVATSAFVLPGLFILALAMLGEVSETQTAEQDRQRKKPIKKKVDDF